MAILNKEAQQTEPPEKKDFSEDKNISIWIDGYDDIFSDFDPRPYSERTISEDFLYELKKISSETGTDVTHIKLLAPEKVRNKEQEELVLRRLHNHFKKSHHYLLQKIKSIKYRAIVYVIIAITMMVSASYVSSLHSKNFLLHVLFVIIEPAGWFLIWTGFENLLNISKTQMPDLDFYEKLTKSKVTFRNIDKSV